MLHGWNCLTDNDRETILRGIADGEVYGGPYHLELDWVDKCNARCFFCNSENLHQGMTMPWERAERLLAEATDLRSMRLSGGGEPTLHPNLPELLGVMAKRGIVLDNLNTNGTQLTERVVDALMQVRVSDVRVSLNYCDPQTYSLGMGLPAHFFDRVRSAVARLNAARQGNPLFGRLSLQFFLYQPTKHQVREMYELGRTLGADLITFRSLWGIDPALQLQAADYPAVIEALREVVREDWVQGQVEVFLENENIRPHVERMYEELRAQLGDCASKIAPREINQLARYCYIGWYSMTLLGNQAVYPCCLLLPSELIKPLDSAKERTLDEIWRGPGFTRFRKEMRDWFLLRRQVPFFNRRVRTMLPACATHTECPLSASMCDDEFYDEADRRLDSIRRTPQARVRALAESIGGVVHQTGRAVKRRLG